MVRVKPPYREWLRVRRLAQGTAASARQAWVESRTFAVM
jgi:hypothetical protein